MSDPTPTTGPNLIATEPGPSAEDLARKLAEVEQRLAKTTAERDEYRASTYSLLNQLVPYQPVTPEELHDMMHGPRGQPVREILAEFERPTRGA